MLWVEKVFISPEIISMQEARRDTESHVTDHNQSEVLTRFDIRCTKRRSRAQAER